MDFEEKIDALRMNLELAFHDIEAFRAGMQEVRESIQELRGVTERQNEGMQETRMSIQEILGGFQEVRMLSESQYENVRGLIETAGRLSAVADSHERRINKIERRTHA